MCKRKISESQNKAIEYITKYALNNKKNSVENIISILKMSNIDIKSYENAINNLKRNARISIHFHPDRPLENKKLVVDSLIESGFYKSQFETYISNGSVSAHAGGDRDLWEQNLFGGAYKEYIKEERPKYGSLNIMFHSDGSSPRFGSCYFLLKPEISKYATYTYMDSHKNPNEKGTYKEFDYIISALLSEIFERDYALGEKNLTITKFINHLLYNIGNDLDENIFKSLPSRNLNHYIEAQVHTNISLKDDVETLVIDPSFKETEIGKSLVELCLKYDINLFYHKGFKLNVKDVPNDFRGNTMQSLAKKIAENNIITAYIIGKACLDLKNNPNKWNDRGDYKTSIQELKLLWHVLLKYGDSY